MGDKSSPFLPFSRFMLRVSATCGNSPVWQAVFTFNRLHYTFRYLQLVLSVDSYLCCTLHLSKLRCRLFMFCDFYFKMFQTILINTSSISTLSNHSVFRILNKCMTYGLQGLPYSHCFPQVMCHRQAAGSCFALIQSALDKTFLTFFVLGQKKIS